MVFQDGKFFCKASAEANVHMSHHMLRCETCYDEALVLLQKLFKDCPKPENLHTRQKIFIVLPKIAHRSTKHGTALHSVIQPSCNWLKYTARYFFDLDFFLEIFLVDKF